MIVMLFLAGAAEAGCYSWPLREDRGGLVAYDGDTVHIAMPGLPPEIAAMSVRLAGVDTPEIRGQCESERTLARQARDFVIERLAAAADVRFCDPQWGRYGGRVVARVEVDGADLAGLLIGRGLGRPYDGGSRRGWCD